MALEENNGTGMVMPVTPMYGGNGGGAFGYGNDGGLFWIIILFLFMFSGFGNGNWGNGGMGSGTTVVANDVQRGFDQSAVMSGLSDIRGDVNSGFAGADVSRCNLQANLTGQLNNLAMSLQNCCCENRAAVADLKYTVATENCADRQAVSDNANMLLNAINGMGQSIKDQMCQDKIDAKNERIQELTTQINMMNLSASQNQQTAQILADNAAQTFALEQYLNPVAKPAYIVANPNGCNCGYNFGNCGCAG